MILAETSYGTLKFGNLIIFFLFNFKFKIYLITESLYFYALLFYYSG
jgi:hypothetical protein